MATNTENLISIPFSWNVSNDPINWALDLKIRWLSENLEAEIQQVSKHFAEIKKIIHLELKFESSWRWLSGSLSQQLGERSRVRNVANANLQIKLYVLCLCEFWAFDTINIPYYTTKITLRFDLFNSFGGQILVATTFDFNTVLKCLYNGPHLLMKFSGVNMIATCWWPLQHGTTCPGCLR